MKPLALLLLVCFFGCSKLPDVVQDAPDKPQATTLKPKVTRSEPEFLYDSLTIAGKTYTVVQGYPGGDSELELRVLYKGDTVFRCERLANNGFEFEDFDGDGITDIRLNYLSNTPGITDLVMFDAKALNFRLVTDFDDYPDPLPVAGTKYYYSYHRSGCADENWGSELFYIENFKAIAIGEIEGIGCEDEERNGIFIYRLNGEERKEIKAITRKPGYYKDKWEFIDKYWRSNYKKFE